MWTAICAFMGIATLVWGLFQVENNWKYYPVTFVVSAAFFMLALTFDPVETLRSFVIDDRPFDSHGSPNYWANLETGEYIHKQDPLVQGCVGNTRPVKSAWGQYQACDLFGDGVLLEAAGAVRQITDAIIAYQNVREAFVIRPGATLRVDRSWFSQRGGPGVRCHQIYAVLPGGKALMDANGLLYQVDGGEWFLAETSKPSGKGTFYRARTLNVQTPDDLPRVMYIKVNVIETPNQPLVAPPSFCF